QICLFASTPDLPSMDVDLSDLLPTFKKQIWNLTDDRDRLNAKVTNMIQELERLRAVKTCPEGWKLLSSSCYFSSTAVGTWETARSDCRKKSADLVIINTKEEQDFISALNKQYWIGLSDREQEGTWTWVDGSPVTLSFWHTGEPNNSGGEDCGETVTYGQWNDQRCDYHRPWICEKQLWS
uniref:C-type lectin domain-containing protein n=1 Tax=Sphaeramia orbicularis TaxID=375764 RepID=A0A672YM78_9TELE